MRTFIITSAAAVTQADAASNPENQDAYHQARYGGENAGFVATRAARCVCYRKYSRRLILALENDSKYRCLYR